MSTPVWQPGVSYAPGAVVKRTTQPPVVANSPTNPDFESGDTGWTKQSGWFIQVNTSFTGTHSGRYTGVAGAHRIINNLAVPVVIGQSITATCMVAQGGAASGAGGGNVQIEWLDQSMVSISIANGNAITSSSGASWKKSSCTSKAPNNAAYMRVSATCFLHSGSTSKSVRVDAFTWNYAYQTPTDSLLFRAVQANSGFSGGTEPVWPSVVDDTVVDNEVTWEAINSSYVTWEAHPILVSGSYEPNWPTEIGASVADGTIVWTAVSRRVSDVNAPQSAVVSIAASKIFAGDDDIIPYSATVNPLDWTTADDAGYLPFGLQTHGANPVSGMGLYRSNLVAFNSAGFQMWQVDQDPINMALLDACPIGCTESRSIQPVMNDLLFLSAVGIRNIAIAGASTNLQAGSTGEPIDTLVLAKVKAAEYVPISCFLPAYGQYWLIFGPEAFVLTVNEQKIYRWSRYTFPEAITDTTLHGNALYLRTINDRVWRVTDDEVFDDSVDGVGEDFRGVIWWPYLDFNALGVEKEFLAIDVTATAPEGVSVSIGYDQRDRTARTDDYLLEGDTLPAQAVPIPVAGPSFDVRLTFEPGQAWAWDSAVFYIQDLRMGA